MKHVPILFSTEMVKAILEGRKTQTRRIIKSKSKITKTGEFLVRPKAQEGDIFWVRETWQITDFLHPSDDNYGYIYKASENGMDWEENSENWKWKPSIFMPKSACRIFLEVTNERVERLHDISSSDAQKEGIKPACRNDIPMFFKNYINNGKGSLAAKESFLSLWESINGKESLESNPWVWVYDFKIVERPENFI